MATLLHLSDLHFDLEATDQRALLSSLVTEFGALERRADRPMLLAITGDVFDTPPEDPAAIVNAFVSFLAEVHEALGDGVRTVILPGNHDRRGSGVWGPHEPGLFEELERVLGSRACVFGARRGEHCRYLDADQHGLPAHLVVYDSTPLHHGLLSAGGVIHREALLQTAHQLAQHGPDPDRCVLFLLHHHLVPTPLTDVSTIDVSRQSRLSRYFVRGALPKLVSFADREELTMTAMGAGTALSTLHSLGHAVLVLHGHKHYATSRLLRGMRADDGDVLLASAGAVGLQEKFMPTGAGARLWPSFNVVSLEEDRVVIDNIAFPPHRTADAQSVRRCLLRASRQDHRWEIDPLAAAEFSAQPQAAERNEARLRLAPGSSSDLWTLHGERRVTGFPEHTEYHEVIEGRPGSIVRRERLGAHPPRVGATPFEMSLQPNTINSYELIDGICRTAGRYSKTYGTDSPAYEWVGLFERYGSRLAQLELDFSVAPELAPFASVTDLRTGVERPARLTVEGTRAKMEVKRCAPRHLLRIYWPLD